MSTVTPISPTLFKTRTQAGDSSLSSTVSTLKKEASSAIKFGKNTAFTAVGAAVICIFGVAKDLIPGAESISEKIVNFLLLLGVGFLGYGLWGFWKDGRKARAAITETPMTPYTLSESTSKTVSNHLKKLGGSESPIFGFSENVVHGYFDPSDAENTAERANAIDLNNALLYNDEITSILAGMNRQSDGEFVNIAGEKSMSSKELKYKMAILAKYIVGSAERDSATGNITDPYALGLLDTLRLEDIEKPDNREQHLYSNEFMAVYTAARHAKEFYPGTRSIENKFKTSTNQLNTWLSSDLTSPTGKQNHKKADDYLIEFRNSHNYLVTLSEAAQYIIKTEGENEHNIQAYKEAVKSKNTKEQEKLINAIRKRAEIESALVAGLELKIPKKADDGESITTQLETILGDSNSQKGLMKKANDAIKYAGEIERAGLPRVLVERHSLNSCEFLSGLAERLSPNTELIDFDKQTVRTREAVAA